MYTNDITQIICHPSTIDRTIGTVKQFAKARKIKTNIDKFLVTPTARTKPGHLNLENAAVKYANDMGTNWNHSHTKERRTELTLSSQN